MQLANDSSQRLRFGLFEADLRTGELTKLGKRIRLEGQPFRLLATLLERPGELITRQELHSRLWPTTTVDFDHGLNKAISKIREALNDSSENPLFVETVARRGYRFLAQVSVVPPHPRESPPSAQLEPQTTRRAKVVWPKGLRRKQVIAWSVPGFIITLILAAGLVWALYPREPFDTTIHSLAVLPMANLSGDNPHDYLADGMTDELISRLGQIGTLRVISRTSVMPYKSGLPPLPEIARTLDVEAVVEGTVFRSGDQVRINVELVRVPVDKLLWGHSYSGNLRDTLALQDSVARDIANQIRSTLNLRERAVLRTSIQVDPRALKYYLEGRYFLEKRTAEGLRTAISYFDSAINADSRFAEAYAGLADSYALSGDWEYGVIPPTIAFEQAKANATKALALNDSLGEAHASLAFSLDLYAWDWKAAETEFKRAIELNPSYPAAHLWYAWHLIETGRKSQGIAELRKAKTLDPLSLIVGADLADALCIDHRFDESIWQSQKTIAMNPQFAIAHYELGQAYAQKRMYKDAVAEFKQAIRLSGHNGLFDSNLGYVYAISGRAADARKIIGDLQNRQDRNPSAYAYLALVNVGLGDRDAAFVWLNKAYAARFNPSILLRPAWEPLHTDPRFKDLLHRIGLPA
ncbi:MAG TPA: winged helix-turn-helix domain-containing protein [Rhizomicrobium sp.]|nr:winged helix-turn-helix domain-containing protein [Rhizomicrobium sp.]